MAEPVDRAPKVAAGEADRSVPGADRGLGHGGTNGGADVELAREDPERPYPGKLCAFRRAVRRERHAQAQSRAIAEVPVRFEGLPCEYLQVDWGEIRQFPFTQQEPATRYFLACRLKYSRWTWVRFMLNVNYSCRRRRLDLPIE